MFILEYKNASRQWILCGTFATLAELQARLAESSLQIYYKRGIFTYARGYGMNVDYTEFRYYMRKE